jgi:hypothetical protein
MEGLIATSPAEARTDIELRCAWGRTEGRIENERTEQDMMTTKEWVSKDDQFLFGEDGVVQPRKLER